jgi:hypothetical protein
MKGRLALLLITSWLAQSHPATLNLWERMIAGRPNERNDCRNPDEPQVQKRHTWRITPGRGLRTTLDFQG